MSEPLARFHGAVRCQRAAGPLGLTLSGASGANPPQPLTVAFTAAAPAGLPELLQDARVEETSPGHYRITSAAGEWPLLAASAHVHRDVGGEFYRAIPPRVVPPGKRLFWKLVLILAASRSGLGLLRALRGGS